MIICAVFVALFLIEISGSDGKTVSVIVKHRQQFGTRDVDDRDYIQLPDIHETLLQLQDAIKLQVSEEDERNNADGVIDVVSVGNKHNTNIYNTGDNNIDSSVDIDKHNTGANNIDSGVDIDKHNTGANNIDSDVDIDKYNTGANNIDSDVDIDKHNTGANNIDSDVDIDKHNTGANNIDSDVDIDKHNTGANNIDSDVDIDKHNTGANNIDSDIDIDKYNTGANNIDSDVGLEKHNTGANNIDSDIGLNKYNNGANNIDSDVDIDRYNTRANNIDSDVDINKYNTNTNIDNGVETDKYITHTNIDSGIGRADVEIDKYFGRNYVAKPREKFDQSKQGLYEDNVDFGEVRHVHGSTVNIDNKVECNIDTLACLHKLYRHTDPEHKRLKHFLSKSRLGRIRPPAQERVFNSGHGSIQRSAQESGHRRIRRSAQEQWRNSLPGGEKQTDYNELDDSDLDVWEEVTDEDLEQAKLNQYRQTLEYIGWTLLSVIVFLFIGICFIRDPIACIFAFGTGCPCCLICCPCIKAFTDKYLDTKRIVREQMNTYMPGIIVNEDGSLDYYEPTAEELDILMEIIDEMSG